MISLLARWCPTSVLILGLISCNQKDVKTLNVPRPTWESERVTESFVQNERALTDQLSFAKSPPAILRATAKCEDRSHRSQAITQFSLPGKIPLYAMLPRELLKPGALSTDVYCTLSFYAFDASNASHTFSLANLRITNSSLAAGIEATADIPVYSLSDLRTAGFRFNHSHNGEVILSCHDFTIVAPATQRRDFSLREIQFPIDFVEGRAHQKCRLLAIENKQVASMSSELPFHFHSGLQIETQLIRTARASWSEPVFNVKMSNQTDDVLRLRWPKTNRDRFALIFTAADRGNFPVCPGTSFVKRRVDTRIDFEKKENLKWLETESFVQLEIPAQTTAAGVIKFGPLTYLLQGPAQLRLLQPMELWSYFGENWIPVDKVDWNITEFFNWFAHDNFPKDCGV